MLFFISGEASESDVFLPTEVSAYAFVTFGSFSTGKLNPYFHVFSFKFRHLNSFSKHVIFA